MCIVEFMQLHSGRLIVAIMTAYIYFLNVVGLLCVFHREI